MENLISNPVFWSKYEILGQTIREIWLILPHFTPFYPYFRKIIDRASNIVWTKLIAYFTAFRSFCNSVIYSFRDWYIAPPIYPLKVRFSSNNTYVYCVHVRVHVAYYLHVPRTVPDTVTLVFLILLTWKKHIWKENRVVHAHNMNKTILGIVREVRQVIYI